MSHRFDPARLGRRVLSAIALGVLLGCSAIPGAAVHAQSGDEGAAQAGAADAGAAPFDSSLMYQLMIAEMAGRRGQLDVAMEGYLEASERTDDARVADRAARLAMFGRRWPEAEQAARRWVELDPASLEGHEALARTLLMQGKNDASAKAHVALVDLSDGADDARRGETLKELIATLLGEEPTRAGIVIDALADAYPDEAEAHLGTARLALGSNDREAALKAVETALSHDPDNADAQLLRARILIASGRADEAFDDLYIAVESAADDVSLQLGRAQLLAEAGRTDAALEAFETLYVLAPENADVLLTIGLLALDAEELEPASRYLEALLETGEYADQTHFYLARIDDDEQRRAAAIEHYEAVQPGQLYVDARVRAAELRALEGDLDSARAGLATLAAEVPDPAVAARLALSEARMLQRADRAGEAVEILSVAIERFPENGDLLYARALAADGAGEPDQLERDLERLIAMEPDNAHALNALGYHLVDANRRLDEAAGYLEKAVALEPDDAAILDSLGWLRYRQGALEEAADLLRRALDMYPDGEIAAHLGEVLWMLGREEEARAIWDAALIDSPDHDVLLRIVEKFME